MKKVAISCGDINGIGLEILLKSHDTIQTKIHPLYCIHFELLQVASAMLNFPLPKTLLPSHCIAPTSWIPKIQKGKITQESGCYSYESFILGCKLCEERLADSLCTLPIHKKAWNLAGIPYLGHTQALSYRYNREAIMMLGCDKMMVVLYTDHIPFKDVVTKIEKRKLYDFFMRLYAIFPQEKYCVMGINPHCGDDGIIGQEDDQIQSALEQINQKLGKHIFHGPFPSDTAFIAPKREKYRVWIAMYHDIGLAPLKMLYFEESINVSLDLPILRTSVDHGVGFDIAYQGKANIQSYLNAILFQL